MKIMHVVWAFLNGGIETMLVNTADEQNLRGHKVSILIINDLVDENLINSFDKEIKMKAVALKLLRKFTVPRIEILDIIYVYA